MPFPMSIQSTKTLNILMKSVVITAAKVGIRGYVFILLVHASVPVSVSGMTQKDANEFLMIFFWWRSESQC